MFALLKEKSAKFRKGLKSGKLEYLLYAGTYRLPEWLLRYYHTYLIEAEKLNLITRSYKGYATRFATVEDVDKFEAIGVSKDKVQHRLNRGDTCAVVLKGEEIVGLGWAATGRLYNKYGGSIIDTGENGVILYSVYVIPEERLKGFFSLCFAKQVAHYRAQNRNKIYGIIEVLNTGSIKTHLRLGFEITGETYCFTLLGISLCYYKKWPFKTKKIRIFFRRPPENLEWI